MPVGATPALPAQIDRPASDPSELPALDASSQLSDYLAYAALNNPGLEAAFLRWKAAVERAPQVSALPDPRFTYRYFIEEVETRVGPQKQRVGLAQTFPWFGVLALRGDMAAEAARAAKQRYDGQKLALFREVKDAYYEYYYLGRAIDVVDENRRLIQDVEEVARARYRAATAEYGEVIRAQVELGKLEDQLRSLVDRQSTLVARLNAALNRDTRGELPFPSFVPEVIIDADDDQVIAWALASSPALLALDHERLGAKLGIELAHKAYYPAVTFGLDYTDVGHQRSGGMATGESGDDALMASLSINLPIRRDKYAAGEREARARHLSIAKARHEQANVLSAKLARILYEFRDAHRKIDLYRNALIPKAEQAMNTTEESFRANKARFTDLVDAQRTLLVFQLAFERALADQAKRLAELEMLVGQSLPQHVVESQEVTPGETEDQPGKVNSDRDGG